MSRSKRQKWSKAEDALLTRAVRMGGAKHWNSIAGFFQGSRNVVQCYQRWTRVLDPTLVKSHWTEEEDDALTRVIRRLGVGNWSVVASYVPGRIGKQCRERWVNHLKPGLRVGDWTEEEDAKLLEIHEELGNAWSLIASRLPGRTENTVKNRFHVLEKTWSGRYVRRMRQQQRVVASEEEEELSIIDESAHAPPPPTLTADLDETMLPMTDDSIGHFSWDFIEPFNM